MQVESLYSKSMEMSSSEKYPLNSHDPSFPQYLDIKSTLNITGKSDYSKP